MIVLNDKQKKAILFFILFVAGLEIIYLSFVGFATTPFYDEKYNITRCPDWQFHNCLAETLDLSHCSWNPDYPGFEAEGGKPNYDRYMPFVHVATAGVAWVTTLPAVFWLAVFNAASLCLMIALLWRHSGGFKQGLLAIAIFLIILPTVLLLTTGNPLYSWIDLVLCGLVPFVFVSALFCFLILEYKNLGASANVLLFVLMVVSHNYGFVLAFFALACIAFELATAYAIRAKTVALTGLWIWLVFLSPYYFTHASERIALMFYFFISMEIATFLGDRLGFKN